MGHTGDFELLIAISAGEESTNGLTENEDCTTVEGQKHRLRQPRSPLAPGTPVLRAVSKLFSSSLIFTV